MVGSSNMISLIGVNTFLCVVNRETVGFQFLDDFIVNGYAIISDYDAGRDFVLSFVEFKPGVFFYVFESVAMCWIRRENFLHYVLRIW